MFNTKKLAAAAIVSIFTVVTPFAVYASSNLYVPEKKETPVVVTSQTQKYTIDRVNLRQSASTQALVYETLDIGISVQFIGYITVDGDVNGWSEIIVNGKTGFVKSEYISDELPAHIAAALAVRYTTDRVNFRQEPSTSANIIETLAVGTQVSLFNLDSENIGDGWSKITYKEATGYIKAEYLNTSKPVQAAASATTTSAAKAVASGNVQLLEWSQVQKIFTIGVKAQIYDIRTGLTYYVKSFSNGNHADVEPVTTEDTAILKKTYGGVWSWSPRPVLVTINGHTFIGSINGMPHGGGVISGNGMDGQVCIHFRGSTTHNGNKSFEKDHQNAITEGWNKYK